ncbi:MAG: sensor histidine kinase [Acidimicrobiia bacterium]
MLTGILIVFLVVTLVMLVMVVVRYRQLDRDVDRILGRLEIEASSKVASRALYRGVRGLERRLEEAEEATSRLRAATERTDIGVVIVDERGDITYANPVALRVLEGSLGDAAAGTRLVALLQRVQTMGREEDLELALFTPARRIVRLRAVPFIGSDNASGAVGYIQDLSGQRRVEAMRSDFLTNAGHEMKTPIGALAVLAETIGDTEDPETRRRLAGRLQSEANRMARVVDDILALADIESLETPFAPLDVGSVVGEAVERVAVSAKVAGVQICTDGTDIYAAVDGNREQIVSAVANLLDNAVKHSAVDEGETVTVMIQPDVDDVAITVEDHGVGIPPDHIGRIFERFYRVDSGRGRDSGGTGLGLSIVKNVAETHGGSVSVESTLGEGSTFTIRLPIARG